MPELAAWLDTIGGIEYPVPQGVLVSSAMHLTGDEVRHLEIGPTHWLLQDE